MDTPMPNMPGPVPTPASPPQPPIMPPVSAPPNASIGSLPSAPAQPPKKGPMLIAVAAVVILVTAAGAAAYTYFGATPSKVMTRSVKAMSELKSVGYKGEIVFTPEGIKPEPGNPLDPSKLKRVAVTVSGNTELGEGKTNSIGYLNGAFEGLFQGSVGLELRSVENKAFVRVTSVPSALPIPFDLTGLVDKWISFPQKTATESNQPALSSLDAAKEKQLRELFGKTKLIRVAKKLSDEKIDNISTYHYKVSLDKEGLKQLVDGIMVIFGNKKESSQEELKAIDESFSLLAGEQADLWIGKSDFLIRRVSYTTSTPISVLPTMADTPGTPGKLSVEVNFSDFNKPVTVTMPEGAVSFEEILQSLLLGINAPSESVPITPPVPMPSGS